MGLSVLQDVFSHQIPESSDPSGDSNGTGSLGMLILALGASEFVAFLICRFLAWYTGIRFYAQESLDWIHSESDSLSEGVKADVEVLAQALHFSEYQPANNTDVCCPICLVDYGKKTIYIYFSCSMATCRLTFGMLVWQQTLEKRLRAAIAPIPSTITVSSSGYRYMSRALAVVNP